MMNDLNESNLLTRPRIDKIFDQCSQLVYVIAGAGYGKTQAVRHYVEQQTDAVVLWVQLTESDNIASHYWENLTRVISFDFPVLAARLREFGFPETYARFKQFSQMIHSLEDYPARTFLVLDDFHLIHSKQTLTFTKRCAYLRIPGACMMIISRKEPEINAIPLFSKGKALVITEDEIRFTDDEVAAFLKTRGVSLSAKELPRVVDVTKGWALAIQLLSLVLKRMPNNLDLALNTMKQNIFKLLEMEAFDDFTESVQKILVRLALISDLPMAALHEILEEASLSYVEKESFIQNMPRLASFLWLDSLIGDYRIHPLYLEFLQSKQGILSQEERLDTYRQAAQWCSENGFRMDAMNYFAKSNQFERMVESLLSYPFKLPYDTCEYFIDIIERLEPVDKNQPDFSIIVLKKYFVPLLLMGTGRYEEAREKALGVIREWESSDSPFAFLLLYGSYSNLAYVEMHLCTVSHEYVAPNYIEKAVEYFELAALPPPKVSGSFVAGDIRSLACVVGEGADLSEFEQFLEVSRQAALHISKTHHNMYYGYDDLVACELAFFRNQPDLAKEHAHQAILKAREKRQYSIEAMAGHYLLRISLQKGEYSLTKETLRQLRSHLAKPDFWNRQLLYDLITGFFYAQIGLPKMATSWLAMDEKESTSEVHIPTRELIVSVKIYIALKKYGQALTVLCNSYPREPLERFLLSELELSLLTAVARIETGDVSGAIKDFEKAYSLSFNGVFEMPFIELGENLHPLIAALSNQPDCGIPDKDGQSQLIEANWLKAIGRKASIYAKKTSIIRDSFKMEQNIKDNIQLSEREQGVLYDLYHGLSREEIAENQSLSINTVKSILQSIYLKLDANNNVDAIRIAIGKKLIEIE